MKFKLGNNLSNFFFVYSFTRELNSVVSPWIAVALLDHQLLLVAEVFQLALVSAMRCGASVCQPYP